MEIPVRYSSLRWKKLKQLDVGSHPFVVPDIAYSSERGLDLAKPEQKIMILIIKYGSLCMQQL